MGHKKVERIDPLTKKQACCGVDSHAHIADKAFDPDRAEVLARAQAVGIAQVITIFLDPCAFLTEKTVVAAYPWIYFALGMHPCDGTQVTPAHFEALEHAFRTEERLVALGEIGLDYYWKDCPRELQIDLFTRQLALARRFAKPVILHCREAEADCLMLLESLKALGF